MKRYEEVEKFFEMANLTPDDTGLPFIIWISPKSGKEKHWARIKVEYDNILYPISISGDPQFQTSGHIKIPFSGKQIKQIKKFVTSNKALLLKYWNSEGKMSLRVVLDSIQKI